MVDSEALRPGPPSEDSEAGREKSGRGNRDADPAVTRSGRGGAESLLRAGISALAHGVAWAFTLWFLLTNASLWRVFPALFKPWEPWWDAERGAVFFAWLGTGAAAVFLFVWTGSLFLRRFSIHADRLARPALALMFGVFLWGVLLEWLAIPGLLYRSAILVAGCVLVVALWIRSPGGAARAVRRDERRQADAVFRSTLRTPRGAGERVFSAMCVTLIFLITLAIFYHALLFPEAYWDSLILYLGYARMMFLEHGVVTKVTGQVGIGLGANYPHLFEFLGAGICTVAGGWSEIPQRLVSPLAGTAATVLVFAIVLRLSRHLNFSLAVTLLYRSIPLGISFDQYATNYSLTVFAAVAFLYLALRFIETGGCGYFVLMSLIIAFGMHINYLMGILLAPWGAAILAAQCGIPPTAADEDDEEIREVEFDLARAVILSGDTPPRMVTPDWAAEPGRPGLFRFAASRTFILTTAACVALGSTWHLRNWIVTGNPVYAFFPEVFGGRNINPEVMKSAAEEWLANGAGIGRFGTDLRSRIDATWGYTVHGWRLAALPQGFVSVAVPLLLARAIVSGGRGVRDRLRGRRAAGMDLPARFGLVVLTLTGCLIAYHYVLAPFYLYQILMVLPCLAVLCVSLRPFWSGPVARRSAGTLALLTGVVPGLAMALMGFKVANAVPDPLTGRMEPPQELYAFRHPMPPPEVMYRWRYDRDASMAGFISRNLEGRRILTHENRHLMFDPSVEFVHLDDWDMQKLWGREPAEQTSALLAAGIGHYLYVPNQEAHRINKRMGTDVWIRDGWVTRVYDAGPNVLYKINAKRAVE